MTEEAESKDPAPKSIRLRGEKIDLARFDLVIDDITEGMNHVASEIAYAGTLWAVAEMELEKADAIYRSWRAKYSRRILEEEPKLAEHKIKSTIESDDGFDEHKGAIATAKRNAMILRAHFDALKIKASALQSRGAMLRAELESTGMSTRHRAASEERTEDNESERATKKKKRKGLVGRGKKKKSPVGD